MELRQRVKGLRDTDQRQNEREDNNHAQNKRRKPGCRCLSSLWLSRWLVLSPTVVGSLVQPLMIAFA